MAKLTKKIFFSKLASSSIKYLLIFVMLAALILLAQISISATYTEPVRYNLSSPSQEYEVYLDGELINISMNLSELSTDDYNITFINETIGGSGAFVTLIEQLNNSNDTYYSPSSNWVAFNSSKLLNNSLIYTWRINVTSMVNYNSTRVNITFRLQNSSNLTNHNFTITLYGAVINSTQTTNLTNSTTPQINITFYSGLYNNATCLAVNASNTTQEWSTNFTAMNATTTIQRINSTLIVGTNYTIRCVNPRYDLFYGGTNNVQIDITVPGITYVYPTENDTWVVNRDYAMVNLSLTDETAMFNVTMLFAYLNGTLVNQTNMSVINLGYSTFFVNFSYTDDETYIFNATAYDLAGNKNSTATRRITLDTLVPRINYTSPTQASGITISSNSIYISALVNETNIVNTTIRLFNGTYYLVNISNSTLRTPSVNFTNLADGLYFFNATITDAYNRSNSTDTRNVTIDITKPNITFVPNTETSGLYLNRNYSIINITFSDTNLKNATVYLYNSTYDLINTTNSSVSPFLTNFSNLADGLYYFNATAYDLAGNTNSTETRNVTIDITKPNITFVPNTETSGLYLNRNYSIINITFSDTNLKNATVYLYNSTYALINTTNSSVSPFLANITNLKDGLYYFNATAFDLAGNTNSTGTRNVTIDTTLPNITFVSPTETSGEAVGRNFILVNATVNDTNFRNLTIFLYNSTYNLINITNTSSTSLFLNFTSLTEQRYFFNATAYDLANNSNSTATRTVTIDTTLPNITFVSPTETHTSTIARQWMIVNVSFSDANLSNVTVYLFNETGTTMSLINTTNSTITQLGLGYTFLNYTNLTDHTGYWFNATAYDVAGNRNITETRWVYVDVTPAPASTPSGGSGGGGSPSSTSKNIELSEAGSTQSIGVSERISFKYDIFHTITLIKIAGSKATITIASPLYTFELGIGQSESADLDGNGIKDIIVTLVNIANGKATLKVQKIAGATPVTKTTTPAAKPAAPAVTPTPTTPEEKPKEETTPAITPTTTTAAKNNNRATLAIIAVLIILAAILYLKVIKPKHRHRHH